jgi:hypothetical protein
VRELSLHILDVVENGITAGADIIRIQVEESRAADLLSIKITDNGRGIPAEKLDNLQNPFVTSRTTRRVGLGLSLLAAAAERCDGKLAAKAGTDGGTEVLATFQYSHIDRAPIGDMASTMTTLMIGNPQIHFVYTHVVDGREFMMDTRELKKELGDHALEDPMVIHHLGESIRTSLNQLISTTDKAAAREKNHGKIDDR